MILSPAQEVRRHRPPGMFSATGRSLRSVIMWRRSAKSIAFRALAWEPVNRALVQPLRRVDRLRRTTPVRSLPIVGTVTLTGVTEPSIMLESDGRDSIASRIFWNGADGYEPESLVPFRNLAQSAKGVLDIGANCGVYALIAAAANPQAAVVAFEPVPEVFGYLRRNVVINGFHNVTVEALAVGANDGDVEFFVPDVLALPTRGSTLPDFRPGGRKVRVQCVTVDSYLRANELPPIDLVKIDAEGSEPAVLAGARDTIRTCRPIVMCEVLDEPTGSAIDRELSSQSYEYYAMKQAGLRELSAVKGGPNFKNLLLVPAERSAFVRSVIGMALIV